jgi:hypothetical protein
MSSVLERNDTGHDPIVQIWDSVPDGVPAMIDTVGVVTT